MSTINAKIKLRRDTASDWTTANPVLLKGEVGIETDTRKAKVGDGTTAWNSLPYLYETLSNTRPDSNGTYVKTAQTTAQNLTALDTALKDLSDFADGMDLDLADVQDAVRVLFNYARWNKWDIDDIKTWIAKQGTFETGTVAMTNTLAFPFNDSQQSISLAQSRDTTNYIVLTEVTAFSGNVGEVEVSDKLVNGFKIAYTGSAPSATIKYTVIGGFQ